MKVLQVGVGEGGSYESEANLEAELITRGVVVGTMDMEAARLGG